MFVHLCESVSWTTVPKLYIHCGAFCHMLCSVSLTNVSLTKTFLSLFIYYFVVCEAVYVPSASTGLSGILLTIMGTMIYGASL